MATNPFVIDPGNNLSAGLSGLSGTLSNIRQDRVQAAEIKRRDDAEAAQRQRQQEASQAAQQAYQSGDPDMMAKVSLQYPEIAQNLHQVVGLNDERKVKEAAGFARDLLMASPDQREAVFQKRIQSLQDQGRDPTHTAQAYQRYLQDPNGAMQGIELDWAAGDPKGYSVIADKEKARAKAALDREKMDREDSRFDRAEAGKNSRAAMSAADRALTRQIAALTAQQGATMNDLKRQELGLKIEEKQAKLDQNKIDTQKAADSAVANIDSSISAADKLLTHPGFSSAVGLSSVLPTRPGSDSADFEAELESFNAKTFLTNVSQMKGLGALTEAEGAKLTSAAGAIKKGMSEKALRNNLQTMKEGMEKAKERMAKRGITSPPPSGSGSTGGWEIIQ